MNSKRTAQSIVYLMLVVFATITLIPFAHMLAGAVKTKLDFAATLFLPAGDGFLGIGWDRITLENFYRLFFELESIFAKARRRSALLEKAKVLLEHEREGFGLLERGEGELRP